MTISFRIHAQVWNYALQEVFIVEKCFLIYPEGFPIQWYQKDTQLRFILPQNHEHYCVHMYENFYRE